RLWCSGLRECECLPYNLSLRGTNRALSCLGRLGLERFDRVGAVGLLDLQRELLLVGAGLSVIRRDTLCGGQANIALIVADYEALLRDHSGRRLNARLRNRSVLRGIRRGLSLSVILRRVRSRRSLGIRRLRGLRRIRMGYRIPLIVVLRRIGH